VADDTIPRRKFLLGAGLAGTAVAAGLNTPAADAQTAAATPPNDPPTYVTLSAAEVAFISAAAVTRAAT
jgi:hypothetical protein